MLGFIVLVIIVLGVTHYAAYRIGKREGEWEERSKNKKNNDNLG